MPKRFHKNPEIKSVEVMLEETMPKSLIVTKEKKEKVSSLKYEKYEEYYIRKILSPDDLNINVISNGNYTIVANQKGVGYSKFNDIYITRIIEGYEEDSNTTMYIKDIKNNNIWTNTINNNIKKPDKYSAEFYPEKSKYSRTDGNITTTTQVLVSTDEAVEIREITIQNNSDNDQASLELYSYLEPILSSKESDLAHMSFNNLFLTFEYLEEQNAVLIKRRQREKKDSFYAIVKFFDDYNQSKLDYEIDKATFFGRGNFTKIPNAVRFSKSFTDNKSFSVNPILAIKKIINIMPKEKITTNLVIMVGNQKTELIENINKYSTKEELKRCFNVAKAKSMVEARYLNVTGKQIQQYLKIAAHLEDLTAVRTLYKDKIKTNTLCIKDLWKFGISGDLPIVLLKIKYANDVDRIDQLLKSHEYLRQKNIKFDLVILDEERNAYERYVLDGTIHQISENHCNYLINQKGGIFLILKKDLSVEEAVLLEAVSSIMFDAHKGDISKQLLEIEDELTKISRKRENCEFPLNKIIEESNVSNVQVPELIYYNEYGGFLKENTSEYIMHISKKNKTPLAYSNIIANPEFGTVVTESGGGYTWQTNSSQDRISRWLPDPICDEPSEIIYIKNSETKEFAPLIPISNEIPYLVTFGKGYSNFKSNIFNLSCNFTETITWEYPVKVFKLELKNEEEAEKEFDLYFYLDVVLGDIKEKVNGNIYVEKVNNEIIGINKINNNKVHLKLFEEINGGLEEMNIISYTGNKNEFIGDGTIYNPKGMEKKKLSNDNGLR